MSVFPFFQLNHQHFKRFEGHNGRGRECYTPASSYFQLVRLICCCDPALQSEHRPALSTQSPLSRLGNIGGPLCTSVCECSQVCVDSTTS